MLRGGIFVDQMCDVYTLGGQGKFAQKLLLLYTIMLYKFSRVSIILLKFSNSSHSKTPRPLSTSKQRQGLSHPTTYPAGSEKHAFQIVARKDVKCGAGDACATP